MPETDRHFTSANGLPVVELDAWSRSVETAEPVRLTRGADIGLVVRHFGPPVIRAVDTVNRRITIVGGSSGVDRYRDRIIVQGYDLSQFIRNPQVPWCHEYWMLPMAAGENPRIEGDDFVLEFDFSNTSRVTPFAAMAWELYAARVLRAASVGGMPETWTMDEARRGMDVTAFGLWEVSGCVLGVQPDALAKAKLSGIDASPMDAWARQVLDEGGSVFIPKLRAEALVKALGYGSGMTLFELDPDAILALRAAEPPPAAKAEPEPEPIEDAEKPKPRQKDVVEEPEDEPKPEEKAAEPEQAEKCPDDEDDMIELDLEADEGEPAAEAVGDEDDEVEVDEEELREAVQTAVQAALRDVMQSTPAGEAR